MGVATMFSKEAYLAINGFGNNYYGWGYLVLRARALSLSLFICIYFHTLTHTPLSSSLNGFSWFPFDGWRPLDHPSSEDDDLWRRTNLVCMPSFLPSFLPSASQQLCFVLPFFPFLFNHLTIAELQLGHLSDLRATTAFLSLNRTRAQTDRVID
jgi:hypothetical protein